MRRCPRPGSRRWIPCTLHLGGEFIKVLGSALEPDGSVTVRAIGQQYSFTLSCLLVPADTPITFRMTSADVVHGFLIAATNINLMLVPGYISSLRARFDAPGERLMPCHESAASVTRGCGPGLGSSTRPRISRALAAQHREADLCSVGPGQCSSPCSPGGPAVWNSKRLVLAHLWVAFAGFGVALLLGEWQMFVRSPLASADR